MQFWFDIDGQRATPAVFIPGFGSIFPKSRPRVTECCPPSKLSKFTRCYGLRGRIGAGPGNWMC
eukprot:scaffold52844_cov63-Phaeocystis_antarctica.AAC.1